MLDTKQEIEEFFEHAGKKGMKWGVRKTSPMSDKTKSNIKKVALVGGATALAAGTIAATAMISRRGMVSIEAVNRSADAALKVAKNAALSASYTKDPAQLAANWREVDAGIKFARSMFDF